jgi:hypothetical protein
MVEIAVHAGEVEHVSPLVVAKVPRGAFEAAGVTAALGRGPVGGQVEGGACFLAPAEGGGADGVIPAQYDAAREELAIVLPGTLAAGATQRFRLAEGVPPRNDAVPFRVTMTLKLDRLVVQVGGEAFTTYNFLGGRRPYFWPVLGPSGASVIRGQGTGEHPHHTGLGINYGGHSEGGSANIWSDWDEPPYGPGGRMVHRGFRRLVSGPVYGEVEQDVTYVDAYGDPIIDEQRTIRFWWASREARFMDFTVDVLSARDRGPQPFLFMMRLPGFFDIPNTGRVTNAVGHPVPAADRSHRSYRAAWADGSGPTGDPPWAPPTAPPETLVDMPGAPRPKQGPGTGPWNGIALFDHPENDGFPGTIGKYAVAQQITQAHYPPAAAPHGPFSFRQRVYVHDGDAEAAGVAARAAQYGSPCRVEVTG